MDAFWQTIRATGAGRPVADPAAARRLAETLGQAAGARVYPESLAPFGRCVAAMARRGTVRTLLVAWPQAAPPAPGEANGFEGTRADVSLDGEASVLVAGPLSAASAAALRRALPWAAPQPIAGRPSFGLGDRLGLATPGHVRAVRGTGFVPVLAQQSIREMTRCGRSPQTVIDDATWGV
ncbi:MAG: hypothetical protein IMZ55_15120, partial [Acidobacteria bacterium]|nr:hypothetical protein [Acidobacteriota bacterium]